MDWFLYDNGLRHGKVKYFEYHPTFRVLELTIHQLRTYVRKSFTQYVHKII